MTASFGHWLNDQMAQRGLTAGRLGKALGCNYATVRAWQLGKSEPGPQLYQQIVTFFGQSPNSIKPKNSPTRRSHFKTFAEWFDVKLVEHGLSNRDVARKLGISTTTVTGWRRGEREPMPDTAKKLGDLFGVEPQEVMALTKWRITA